MDEEHKSNSPTPSDPSDQQPTTKRHISRSQRDRQRRSVFQYITILFIAAFVLLLYTFLMERRQHQLLQAENEEQISSLQQSVSAVQSIQNLYDENAALKERVQVLETELNDLNDTVDDLSLQLTRTSQAMDYFWQVDEAYVRGRYTLCRTLIHTMEAEGLTQYLPAESYTDNGRFSPADRYQEIYDKLF
jgi:uncharacterized protein HemX